MAATDKLRPIARRALAAQSDERLVRLIREGHAPAFEEVVRRYRSPLVAFAAAIVSTDRAEDVVQAALQKAHAALRADDREINLRPWLFAIARNGALNLIRDDPAWEEVDPNVAGAPQPAAVAEQNEDLHRLVIAICALPDAQRQALVRREIDGEGHAEIAASLGTSATAVRGLIFRARTALRDGFGALIPLPVLRLLMTEGAAAGGGAAVGGLALGTGGKAGVVVTTAALALGGGLAAERADRGEPVAEASPSVERESGAEKRSRSTGESGATGLATAEAGSSGPGGNAGPGGGEDSGDDDRSDDENEGEGSESEGPGENAGPGGGGDDDGSGEASGGDDGSSSGPGSGDDDSPGSSGPGGSVAEEDHSSPGGGGGSDDPPQIEVDDSGPGSGSQLGEIEGESEQPTGESGNSGPGGGGSSGSGSSEPGE